MDESTDVFSLAGKRILITGASSGIGRQTAIACTEMGAQVLITGRNVERLADTLRMLKGEGHQSFAADLTRAEDLATLVASTDTLHGVVHAAGISKLVPLRMVTQAHLEETLSTNTLAPIMLTKTLVAKKRIAAGGSIVFVSALASHTGAMASTAYAASKGAIMSATRVAAHELAKSGIRANCISPGFVRTPLLEGLAERGAQLSSLIDIAPLGLGEPEDVANATVFFLSEASRWISNTHFIVDGGLTTSMDIFA